MKVAMKYQRVPMPPKNLEETVARYNSLWTQGRTKTLASQLPNIRL